jgi:HD-GYP domain-containing protein (c-di-GMP phosphodiesterase class II)
MEMIFKEITSHFNLLREEETWVTLQRHSLAVTELAHLFSKFLELDPFQNYKAVQLAKFHDIGELSISSKILFKPTELSKVEIKIHRLHSEYGESFISIIPELQFLSKFVRHHHEQWDGKGYPDGLKGKEIPLENRIISIVDSFETLTAGHCFINALAIVPALEEIKINSGSQFDPCIVLQFLKFIEINYKHIAKFLASTYTNKKLPGAFIHASES